MGKLRYSPAARQDLLEIWVNIALDNPAAADRVVDRLEAVCVNLCAHPNLGRARPEIGEGARALVIDHWLALYTVEPDGVQVVRVIDGARDLEQLPWAQEAGS